MAANTEAIYTKRGNIGIGSILLQAANTTKDGTGAANKALIFTAGADGSLIYRVRARAVGNNVATVLRIFINNGSDVETAANNILYTERTLPATTLSETTELLLQEMPNTTDTTSFPLVLPAGYRLYATLGTSVSAGYRISVLGGDY